MNVFGFVQTVDRHGQKENIASIRPQEQVGIRGFACIEPNLHMIEWLGRGRDVRKFVVNDAETELFVSAGRNVVDPVTGATQFVPTWPATEKFMDFTPRGPK